MRWYGHDRSILTEILPEFEVSNPIRQTVSICAKLFFVVQTLTPSQGQINFDLSLRTELTQKFLDSIYSSEAIKFEPYLQYVYIPNLRVVNVKMKALEDQSWWDSLSCKDFVIIFEWLRARMRVKRILEIVVDDDPKNPHSDEVIEQAVKSFDVEQWDWVKLDMCADTILAAAQNVRHLTLYWSGNKAVLNSWAADDGLARLEKVRI